MWRNPLVGHPDLNKFISLIKSYLTISRLLTVKIYRRKEFFSLSKIPREISAVESSGGCDQFSSGLGWPHTIISLIIGSYKLSYYFFWARKTSSLAFSQNSKKKSPHVIKPIFFARKSPPLAFSQTTLLFLSSSDHHQQQMAARCKKIRKQNMSQNISKKFFLCHKKFFVDIFLIHSVFHLKLIDVCQIYWSKSAN